MCEWGLIPVDPVTLERLNDAEEFDGDAATAVTIEDLDLMLVGAPEGPVGDLCQSGRDLPPRRDPGCGEADRGCAGSIIDPEFVRQCAERVAGVTPDKFASFEAAIQGASHAVDEVQAPTYYGWLAESAEQFQHFIASAAQRGAALKFWVAG